MMACLECFLQMKAMALSNGSLLLALSGKEQPGLGSFPQFFRFSVRIPMVQARPIFSEKEVSTTSEDKKAWSTLMSLNASCSITPLNQVRDLNDEYMDENFAIFAF